MSTFIPLEIPRALVGEEGMPRPSSERRERGVLLGPSLGGGAIHGAPRAGGGAPVLVEGGDPAIPRKRKETIVIILSNNNKNNNTNNNLNNH